MNARIGRISLLFCVLVCTSAGAKDDVPVPLPVLTEVTVDSFQPQVDTIRAGFQPAGRYEYIKEDEKVIVNRDLDQMSDLIRKNGNVEAMNTDERIALFNLQEKVNSILTHSDSSRLICEKTIPTGSLMKVTSCHTYGDLVRRARMTEKELQAAQNQTGSLQISSFKSSGSAH